MNSEWLRQEPNGGVPRHPGVFARFGRGRGLRGLVAVVAGLMVAVGLAAAPAQADGTSVDSSDVESRINNSFLVQLQNIDATAVTIMRDNGQSGFSAVDATIAGTDYVDNVDLSDDVFVAYVDASSVFLYVNADFRGADATLAGFSATIAEGSYSYTVSGSALGTIGPDNDNTDFVATAPPAGSKQVTFELKYPTDGTPTWSSDLFAAFTADGKQVPIADATFTEPVLGYDYRRVSGALTIDAPFNSSIRLGVVDFFAALSNAVTLTASSTPDSGGGSSTPTAPSTDTGSGTSAGESPAPATVQPVVFADPAVVTAAEIAALTPAQVATITPEQIRDLDPAAFAGFTPAQVNAMDGFQINAIRPARAAQLSPLAVSVLDGGRLYVMRPASVAALQPRALEILTAGQIGSIRPQAFKLMDGERINKIRPVQVEFMNPAQIKAINIDGISEMRLDTLQAFTPEQIRAFRPAQLAAMRSVQIAAIVGQFGADVFRPRQDDVLTILGPLDS